MSILPLAVLLAAAQSNHGIAASAAEAKLIPVGSMAPDAALLDSEGRKVTLKSLTDGKATVLVFYRGSWCPFCNRHLADLVNAEGQLKDMGVQILAVSPDKPDKLKVMSDTHKLDYTLLSDPKLQAMRAFGVAFRVDDDTYSLYKSKYQLDLEKESGNDSHVLPVPSVFVIDKAGKVVFSQGNPDYKVRMSAAEVVAAAKKALSPIPASAKLGA